MERALQNYERVTQEAKCELCAAWEAERETLKKNVSAWEAERETLNSELRDLKKKREAERETLNSERQDLEKERTHLELELSERHKKLEGESKDLEKKRTRLELEMAEGRRDMEEKLHGERQHLEQERARLELDLEEKLKSALHNMKQKRRRLERNLAETLKTARQELEQQRLRLVSKADAGRRELEEERAARAADLVWAEEMAARSAHRVLLDVGGWHFATTRRTLTAVPASRLDGMCGGRSERRWPTDKDGRIFLDRNGAMFEYILDFLRGCSWGDAEAGSAIRALPELQLVEMRRELDYYGLEEAVFPPVTCSIQHAHFSPGPEMLSKRWLCGAVLLPCNKGVLVVGGHDGNKRVASTEVLNLETSTFSPGPSMRSGRSRCGTTILENGAVVVVGGSDGTVLATTTVLHPASSTWCPGPTLAEGRFNCAALPFSGGRILVIGGNSDFTEKSYLSTTEIIKLGSWISIPGPEMSCPRSSCSAVMLHDGRVLVIGGKNQTNMSLSTTEVLDLTKGSSNPGPNLEIARSSAAAALLPGEDGVLVIGGRGNNITDLDSTEVLDVAGCTTTAGPVLSIPRSHGTAVQLPGDRILVLGGYSDGTSVSTSEMLDFQRKKTPSPKQRLLRMRSGLQARSERLKNELET